MIKILATGSIVGGHSRSSIHFIVNMCVPTYSPGIVGFGPFVITIDCDFKDIGFRICIQFQKSISLLNQFYFQFHIKSQILMSLDQFFKRWKHRQTD